MYNDDINVILIPKAASGKECSLMSVLPPAFAERMKTLLRDDYEAFEASYSQPRTYGLRVNTAKISCGEFERIVPFPVRKIPWIPDGYFVDPESRPARCPLYLAGLYYLQDPGAMTPASFLEIGAGMRVLDLCAAPGGKAVAAGALLNQKDGILIANDISTQRARALLRNLELSGMASLIVTDEAPSSLAKAFPPCFDRVILDAPCSGEGMFRKEPALLEDWSEEKSAALARLQRELILVGSDLLAPGGLLLYSTCTFSPSEDEGVIAWLLEQRKDMELIPVPWYEGFSEGIIPPSPESQPGEPAFPRDIFRRCVRIYPHRMPAEGHFFALLQKAGDRTLPAHKDPKKERSSERGRRKKKSSSSAIGLFHAFLDEIGLRTLGGAPIDPDRLEIRGEKLYYLPSPDATAPLTLNGISFLRYGLFLGELRKNRFEPSQPFALAVRKGEAARCVSFSVSDPRLEAYLAGISVSVCDSGNESENPLPGTAPGLPGEISNSLMEPSFEVFSDQSLMENGWVLVCVMGYPIGFGKLVNGIIKNKIPAGWRVTQGSGHIK